VLDQSSNRKRRNIRKVEDVPVARVEEEIDLPFRNKKGIGD